MSKFPISMLAFLVAGFFAAVIDAQSDDLHSDDKQFNEFIFNITNIMSRHDKNQFNVDVDVDNFKSVRDTVGPFNDLNDFNANNVASFPKIEDPFKDFSIKDFTHDFNFQLRPELNDFKECTEIKDTYVKYDGSSSCVNLYYDSVCTKEKWLSSNAEYSIGSIPFVSGNVKVCNNARDVKMYVVTSFGLFCLLIWVCVKCVECFSTKFRKNKNEFGSAVNLV